MGTANRLFECDGQHLIAKPNQTEALFEHAIHLHIGLRHRGACP